jgi:hypothetical protein
MAASLAMFATTSASSAAAVGQGGSQPAEPSPGCAWSHAINVTYNNVGYLDSNVNYWYDKVTVPAGASVIFHGQYPSARYFSLGAYVSDPSAKDLSTAGLFTDYINDTQIAPDPGSSNPFLPGASRVGQTGSWTVTLSGDKPPADPQDRRPNTLYGGNDQNWPTELMYRVYVADKNFAISGGVGLPQPTVVLADGTQLTGQDACNALAVDTTPFTIPTVPLAAYNQLTHLPANPAYGLPGSGPNAPATNPARWYRVVNSCHYTDVYFQAAGYPLPKCPNNIAVTAYPNPDNGYIVANVNRNFGPAPDGHNVLVVTGRMPTTPATYSGNPKFAGGTQLRYWGLCTNESGVTTAATGPDGCAYDEQVPLDAQRNYTIVISTPGDRPANAIDRCGVAWLNWGNGDGAGNPAAAALMLRTLMPGPSFNQGAQNVLAPGLPSDVSAAMGPYMPALQYESPSQVEALGCHPAATR